MKHWNEDLNRETENREFFTLVNMILVSAEKGQLTNNNLGWFENIT